MLIFAWLMACGPSQDQLDCLSECDDRKRAFPGMSVCIEQQNENQNYRINTIKELQTYLNANVNRYNSSKNRVTAYDDYCISLQNEGKSAPESDIKALVDKYLRVCGLNASEPYEPHRDLVKKYEKNLEKSQKLKKLSDQFQLNGGSDSKCRGLKEASQKINCEAECKHK